MARQRYTITEKAPLPGGTRQFRVLTDAEAETHWRGRDVWAHQRRDKWVCNCTECSSVTVAMLSSCAHSKAVARHLAKEVLTHAA